MSERLKVLSAYAKLATAIDRYRATVLRVFYPGRRVGWIENNYGRSGRVIKVKWSNPRGTATIVVRNASDEVVELPAEKIGPADETHQITVGNKESLRWPASYQR